MITDKPTISREVQAMADAISIIANDDLLIAAAGLPDEKLRKFMRLIGEKQNTINIERETIKY